MLIANNSVNSENNKDEIINLGSAVLLSAYFNFSNEKKKKNRTEREIYWPPLIPLISLSLQAKKITPLSSAISAPQPSVRCKEQFEMYMISN